MSHTKRHRHSSQAGAPSRRATLAKKLNKRQALLSSVTAALSAPSLDPVPRLTLCACPHCGQCPAADELCYSSGPLNVKVECPNCEERITPTLRLDSGALIVALGPVQTRDQYRELLANDTLYADMPEEIFVWAPHLAWNAYLHSPCRYDGTKSVLDKVVAFVSPVHWSCPNCANGEFYMDTEGDEPYMGCSSCHGWERELSPELLAAVQVFMQENK